MAQYSPLALSSSAGLLLSTMLPFSSTKRVLAGRRVERRWAIKSVMRLRLVHRTGDRSERRRGLVKNQQARMADQGLGNRQPLLFAARELHARLADDQVQPFGRPGHQVLVGAPVGAVVDDPAKYVRIDRRQHLADD
ncbi:hypothetical protein IWX85_001475 [Polaromonas sp. CG_9.11]|nr:hypothetical protein [Polaromonas sp. CG_9.11]